MEITVDNVREALKKVIEPDLKKDIITLDLVSDIRIEGGVISFEVKVYNPAMHAKVRMNEALQFALERAFGKEVDAKISLVPLQRKRTRSTCDFIECETYYCHSQWKRGCWKINHYRQFSGWFSKIRL